MSGLPHLPQTAFTKTSYMSSSYVLEVFDDETRAKVEVYGRTPCATRGGVPHTRCIRQTPRWMQRQILEQRSSVYAFRCHPGKHRKIRTNKRTSRKKIFGPSAVPNDVAPLKPYCLKNSNRTISFSRTCRQHDCVANFPKRATSTDVWHPS